MRTRGGLAAICLALVVGTTAACTSSEDPEPSPEPTGEPVRLSFGTTGSDAEAGAWDRVAADFDGGDDVTVDTVRLPEEVGALEAQADAGNLPDVFLADRSDLAWLVENEAVQPVDELLDERGVDFGDRYSRDALQAFSSDNALQCMPVGISPMVVYYNTDLIDFDRMRARGLDAPASTNGWTLGSFAAAAEFATRPGRGTRGLHIDPTLRGFAPLVYSAGGQVFDDEVEPSSLSFSSDETRSALETFLPLLRNRPLNLTADQLERRSALEWFERGRVGMIAGTRELVPELRRVDGLRFDVMPMPFLGDDATVGDVTGLCLSAETKDPAVAADFLVHALSAESIGRVTRVGELVPADLEVSVSDDFVQPARQPRNPQVFTESIRDIRLAPLLDTDGALSDAAAPFLAEMVDEPVLAPEDLEVLGAEIDLASREVLSPDDIDLDGTPDDEDDDVDPGLLPSEEPDEDDPGLG